MIMSLKQWEIKIKPRIKLNLNIYTLPGARFSKVPVTYRPDKYIFKRFFFFADYTLIREMVHGQCFLRIIRF